jgi:hypothetical protein
VRTMRSPMPMRMSHGSLSTVSLAFDRLRLSLEGCGPARLRDGESGATWGDMGKMPCMDDTSAEVDAVQVDGPQGHPCRGHLRWDGQGVAMRLIEDKRVRNGLCRSWALHTIIRMSLWKSLRVSRMCEFWMRIRGRIWSGGNGLRRRRVGTVCVPSTDHFSLSTVQ